MSHPHALLPRQSSPTAAITAAPSPQTPVWLAVTALVALVLASYITVLERGGFIWDDDVHITHNVAIRSASGLARIWTWAPQAWFSHTSDRAIAATPQYYPLVFTTFWLEYHLWGGEAALGYHMVNILLHAASAVLVWRILRRLHMPGAFLAAALWATHPVMVESVAWMTERKNVLSGFFYLAAGLTYLHFARIEASPATKPQSSPRSWMLYGWSWALFMLALASKTVACSFPVALGLVLWAKRRFTRTDLLALLPMLIVGLLAGRLTAWVETTFIGATGPDWNFSWVERLLIAGQALWFYAFSLVYPANLTFIYPRWQIDTASATQWFLVVAAAALPVLLFLLQRRIGRMPFAAVAFFGLTLAPALGFVNVYPMLYSFVADHFQYLASLGLLALAAAGLASIFAQLDVSDRWLAYAASGILLATLAFLSARQGRIYQDSGTLYRDILAKNPNAWMAHENLAAYLRTTNPPGSPLMETAIQHYQETLRLRPQDAKAYNGWGQIYAERGDYATAVDLYAKGLLVDPHDAMLLTSYGVALNALNRHAEARFALQEAVAANPDYLEAHLNLGNALRAANRNEEALAHDERAISLASAALRLDPSERTRTSLANAFLGQGASLLGQRRYQEAIAAYRTANQWAPNRATTLNNLGLALQLNGQREEALETLNAAVATAPNFVGARLNRGLTLAAMKRFEQALADFHEAARLEPANPLPWGYLAEIYGQEGPLKNLNEAIVAATKACDLSDHKDPLMLGLLETSLFKAGRLSEAIAAAQQTMDLVKAGGDQTQALEIAARIEGYRQLLNRRALPALSF